MLLKLLFSVNCHSTVAYRADHSLHLNKLWVHHIVNYIIPPHMWVRHTWDMWVRHVSDFPFRWARQLPYSVTVAFRPTKFLTTLRADVQFSITCGSATQWVTLFPLTCGCTTLWQMWVRHIYEFYFLRVRHLPSFVTVTVRATKILTTLRTYVHFSIPFGSATQWITLFLLACGSATPWEMWVCYI